MKRRMRFMGAQAWIRASCSSRRRATERRSAPEPVVADRLADLDPILLVEAGPAALLGLAVLRVLAPGAGVRVGLELDDGDPLAVRGLEGLEREYRKSVGEGKRGDVGGCRSIKKKGT